MVSFKHPIDQNIFHKQMWMKKISINEKRTCNLRALGVLWHCLSHSVSTLATLKSPYFLLTARKETSAIWGSVKGVFLKQLHQASCWEKLIIDNNITSHIFHQPIVLSEGDDEDSVNWKVWNRECQIPFVQFGPFASLPSPALLSSLTNSLWASAIGIEMFSLHFVNI